MICQSLLSTVIFVSHGVDTMKAIFSVSLRRPHDSRLLPSILLMASFLVLSGCSYVPDAVNPVEWYKDVAGWFGDDEEGEVAETGPDADDVKTSRAGDAVPGADKDYPKLSSVPDGPTEGERQRIVEGLAADTADRSYSDEAPPSAPVKAVTPPPTAGSRILPPPPPMPEPGGPPVGAPRESVTNGPVAGKTVAAPPPPDKSALSPTVAKVMEKVRGDAAGDKTAPSSMEKFDASRAVVSAQVGLIRFNNGSAALSSADRSQLKSIAESQKKSGGTLRVIGFASSWTGNMDPLKHQLVNFDVSMRRANSVAVALMKYGVEGKSLYVGAKSDSEPIYLEVMPAGEAGNRRTEIYLDY